VTLTVRQSVLIRRSPHEVFAYVSDFNRAKEWRVEVRESTQTPPGPMVKGSRLHEESAIMGRRVGGVPSRPASLLTELGDHAAACTFLIGDQDAKFTRAFDDGWRATGIQIIGTPAPNANAVAERWIGTVRRAWLDQLLIVGREHLVDVVCASTEHDHRHRRHRSLGQGTPVPSISDAAASAPTLHRLRRRDILGGLIHQDSWVA
jgi:Polyketide cyclase / dehydrase and lipid transport